MLSAMCLNSAVRPSLQSKAKETIMHIAPTVPTKKIDEAGVGFSTQRTYIGAAVVRPNAKRHLEGRGIYVDDIALPRLAHVVYLRSPLAHARIGAIDADQARGMPGIIAIVDGHEIATICTPWTGTLAHLIGMKSAPQYPLAIERACWQGEPVLAIVAETRHQAEDALQTIVVDWQELPVVGNMETALAPKTPVIHPALGDNLCFHKEIDTGAVDGWISGN